MRTLSIRNTVDCAVSDAFDNEYSESGYETPYEFTEHIYGLKPIEYSHRFKIVDEDKFLMFCLKYPEFIFNILNTDHEKEI